MYGNPRQAGFTDQAPSLSHCNIYSLIFLESEDFLSASLYSKFITEGPSQEHYLCIHSAGKYIASGKKERKKRAVMIRFSSG